MQLHGRENPSGGLERKREHIKKESVDYLDYYSSRRSKAKRKGLLPAHRQQALSRLNSNICLTFGVHFIFCALLFMYQTSNSASKSSCVVFNRTKRPLSKSLWWSRI